MNKKKLLALLAKKEERKTALVTKSESSEDVAELRSINTELDTLNTEISELRSMIDLIPDTPEASDSADDTGADEQRGGFNPIATYGMGGASSSDDEARKAREKALEKRGGDLKDKKAVVFELEEVPEFRATTVGSGTLVVPTNYSNSLNPTFQQISGVIDMVNSPSLPGGDTYRKGFEVSIADADKSTETGNYNTTDPVFDYVDIVKSKITAYAEISDEATKLPNVNYQAYVGSAVAKSLRKKVAKMIPTGAGGANTITGIFAAPANVIPPASDIAIAEIDEDTLDAIVFGYGGDESMEGQATLMLSKTDLAAFAAVRDADGEKLYKIKLNGSTGTISSDGSFEVPFVINSACPALSVEATAADTYCMAYGNMQNYEMPTFSPVTVEESRDYKFASGQICYRGTVWIGGNVAAYKGFVRIKKG